MAGNEKMKYDVLYPLVLLLNRDGYLIEVTEPYMFMDKCSVYFVSLFWIWGYYESFIGGPFSDCQFILR